MRKILIENTSTRGALSLLFLWALLSAGCGNAGQKTSDAASADTSLFKEGKIYRYTMHMKNSSRVSEKQPALFEMTADMVLVPRVTASKETELFATFENIKLNTDEENRGAAIETMTRELTEGKFSFAYKDGRSVFLRLPKGLSPFSMGIVRSAAAALQFPGNAEEKQRWTVEEYDGTGRYEAAYQKSGPGVFTKKKLRYRIDDINGKDAFKFKLKMTAAVKSSEGRTVIKDGALAETGYTEVLESKLDARNTIVSETTLKLALTKKKPLETAPDWEEMTAVAKRIAADKPYVERNRKGMETALDPARIGGRTYEEALAYLTAYAAAKADKANLNAEEKSAKTKELGRMTAAMAAILRTRPETVEKVRNEILENSPAATLLLDCLAGAGSEQAQNVLIDILKTESADMYLRRLAAQKLTRTSRPTDKTVSVLKKLLDDKIFGTTAVYGLGTISRVIAESGETERAGKIAVVLVKRLRQTDDKSEKIRLLRGIANSAYIGALDAVKPLLSAEDDEIRGNAVQAMRLMKGEKADRLIADALEKEDSRRARLHMLSAASARDPSDRLIDVLAKIAVEAPDSQSRMKALKQLARRIPGTPKLEKTLRAVLEKDDNEAVKEFARRAMEKAAPQNRSDA